MPLPYLNKLRGVRVRVDGEDIANAARVLGLDFLDSDVEYDPVTGYVTIALGSAGGTSVSCRATVEGNSAATNSTANFVATSGSNFAQVKTGAGWTFAAAGCLWTYTGQAGRRFMVTLNVSVYPASAFATAISELIVGIDHDGDLIGTSSPSSMADSVIESSWDPTTDQKVHSMHTTKLIEPANGDTVQPCFGREALPTVPATTITRLNMTIVEVGAG